MVRIIANAIESGYDAEVPMRSDVDPEMQKVGLGHQKSADQGRAPCTALAVSFVLVGHLRRSTLARKSPSVYLLLYLSHARPCVSEIVFSSSASRSRMCDGCAFAQDARKAQRSTGCKQRVLLPLHYNSWGCGGPFSRWGFDDSYPFLIRDVSCVS